MTSSSLIQLHLVDAVSADRPRTTRLPRRGRRA
jgi:hypothetical protein